MGSHLQVDSRGYETRQHGSYDFPVQSGSVKLSVYENSRFCHHWHKDPEFTVIADGEMNYQVNDHLYHLTAGQGILVNSNMLHSGWNDHGDCAYTPINFDAQILFGYNDSRVYRNFVEPIVTSPYFSAIVFDPEKGEDDAKVIDLFRRCRPLMKEKKTGYEMQVISYICEAWSIIAPRALEQIDSMGSTRVTKQISRMKNAIDYVEKNYAEQITLDELASICGLSRSELCRCFKSIMRQTPMEYVTSVRVRKSLPLLAGRNYSVTQIAEMCGFSGSSYFAEMFRRQMQCTPSQYAKKSEK